MAYCHTLKPLLPLSFQLEIYIFIYLCLLIFVSLQAKAMQDPEIQNILQDPVMRQVC